MNIIHTLKAIACIFILFCLSTISQAETLKIYHIDVEQGDATLLISPTGETLLIDSGKNGHGPRIKAILDQENISQIDHFVATHYHEDHYGGIDDLVNAGVTITHAYDRGDKDFIPTSKKTGKTYMDYHNAVGKNAVTLRQGHTIDLGPSLRVECIANGGTVLNENPHTTGNDENDMSIALLIQFGQFRYFIGGDIEATTEGKIADNALIQNVDVYQANHHGSHTSSSLAFMQDLVPGVIIISNGNNAKYMHPRAHTLTTYANLTPTPVVFQTNKYTKGGLGGNVPDSFIADPESSDQDGTILVTADSTANTYTVSYGANNQSFQTKARGTTTAATQVVIERVLPNPVGSDLVNERVTLINKGSQSVSLSNWSLRDASHRIWTLSGLSELGSQQSITVQRNRMAMSLNNGGDTISLIDDTGQTRDQFQYSGSQEGVAIDTGH